MGHRAALWQADVRPVILSEDRVEVTEGSPIRVALVEGFMVVRSTG